MIALVVGGGFVAFVSGDVSTLHAPVDLILETVGQGMFLANVRCVLKGFALVTFFGWVTHKGIHTFSQSTLQSYYSTKARENLAFFCAHFANPSRKPLSVSMLK